MLKAHWIFLPLFMAAGVSSAASLDDLVRAAAEGGIVETTDPNVAAQVEQTATQLASRQQEQTVGASGTAGTGEASRPAHSRPYHGDKAGKQRGHSDTTGHSKSGT